jgi:rhodanese-related sulfurtransferase
MNCVGTSSKPSPILAKPTQELTGNDKVKADWIKDVNPDEHFFLHCAGGYRSMIAASILQARGYRNFSEVEGGFSAIAKTNVAKTDFVCQSKVL